VKSPESRHVQPLEFALLDESMEGLSKTLHEMASHLEIFLPDSTAWI